MMFSSLSHPGGRAPDFTSQTNQVKLAPSRPQQSYDVYGDSAAAFSRDLARTLVSQLPDCDSDWNSKLSTRSDVKRIVDELTLSRMRLSSGADFDWLQVLSYFALQMKYKRRDTSISSFYALVFISTCNIAILDDCPVGIVNQAMKNCLRDYGMDKDDLHFQSLERIRGGAVAGIRLLNECMRVVGYRAYELPLHCKNDSNVQRENPRLINTSAQLDFHVSGLAASIFGADERSHAQYLPPNVALAVRAALYSLAGV